MNSLALRSADFLDGAVEYGADGWLPDEAPLDMPRQDFGVETDRFPRRLRPRPPR
jgi:hypothetical protein